MNNLLLDFSKDIDIDGGLYLYSFLMNLIFFVLSLLILLLIILIILYIYYLFFFEVVYDSYNFLGDYYLIG